jgi:hypothetical protein
MITSDKCPPAASRRALGQKHQTVMIVTGAANEWEYLKVGVAVFATLALYIVGFGAWAHKRVDAQ